MKKRFCPDKSSLRKLIYFRGLPKDVQNAVANSTHHLARIITVTHNEECTKITLCNQRVKQYIGGQAFVQNTVDGTISYFHDNKKVYTQNAREVILFLQNNHYIVKALGIEAFITDRNMRAPKLNTDFIVESLELEVQMYTYKNILKAIFKGNCTNRDNATRRFCKSRYGMNISLKAYCKMQTFSDSSRIHGILLTTTNFDNAFNFLSKRAKDFSNKERSIVNDLVAMSLTHRRKINFAWSAKRMELEHDKLVKESVKLQAEGLQFTEVGYQEKPPSIPGITYFTNNQDLLIESKTMKHCIGTSDIYLDRLLEHRSILIAYDRLGTRATAEIAVDYGMGTEGTIKVNLRVSQFYMRGNKQAPKSAREDLEKVVDIIMESKFKQYLEDRRSKKGDPIEEASDRDALFGDRTWVANRQDVLQVIAEVGDYHMPF